MKKQFGITLLELIMVLVIISLLAALAVPGFGSLVRSNAMSTKFNSLSGDISLARLHAIKRSRSIILCASADATTCSGTDWSTGWLVFSDDNRDGSFDTGDVVLQIEPAAASYLSITSAQFGSSLTIAPRGRLSTSGTFLICNGDSDDTAKALNLQVTGLGRIATDNDADGIVEDAAGNNVDCS